MADDKIKVCPATDNCVSSLKNEARERQVAHFPIQVDFVQSKTRLKEVIAELPRTKLISESEKYLHFTFTSLIFRFVDDVEFELDETKNIIHVRSASRVGRSDLGVNAKRVAQIRRLYTKK